MPTTGISGMRPRILAIAGGLLLAITGTTGYSQERIDIDIAASEIRASTADPRVEIVRIRISGPDFEDEKAASSGSRLIWRLPSGTADGVYRYDIYGKGASESQAEDAQGSGQPSYRESGRFLVDGGVMSKPSHERQSSFLGGLGDVLTAALDFVVSPAAAADLTASGDSPQVNFDDETDTAGTIDWSLHGNEFDITPNNFYLFDNHNRSRPLIIEQGAGDNALLLDSNGDATLADGGLFVNGSSNEVGINTSPPPRN